MIAQCSGYRKGAKGVLQCQPWGKLKVTRNVDVTPKPTTILTCSCFKMESKGKQLCPCNSSKGGVQELSLLLLVLSMHI